MDQLPAQGAGNAAPAAPAPSLEDRFGAVMDKEFGLKPPQGPQDEQPAAKIEPAQADESQEQSQEAEKKTAQGPEISSLQELAKFNEVPYEELLGLEVPVKVDGQDTTAKLEDVLKSYQLEKHVNNKSMEVSQKLKEVETQTTQFQQARQAEIQRLQSLGAYANQMIHAKYQAVDWGALKANDPVAYAATWTEFQQDQGNVNAYLNQVQLSIQQQQAEAQKAQQAKFAEEQKALLGSRPEWSDAAVREKDFKAITASLRAVGFTPEEIGNVLDHRAFIIADKAARYDALQAKKPEVTQKLQAAPRIVRPGSRAGQAKPSKLADLKGRLRQNPRDQDVAAAAFGEYAEQSGLLND